MDQSIQIRKAKADDMIFVYEMIKELAEYEKMPEGPKIDDQILRKDGFEISPPGFMCLIAEIENVVVGYALYYFTYSTWRGRSMYLEDLYVKPEYRRHNIGTKLFKRVANETIELNCARLDFQVLSWNPAISFYEKHFAKNLTQTENWNCFRLDDENLKQLTES